MIGLRPLGHPRVRARSACAAGAWLGAIAALMVLIVLPPGREAAELAAEVVFLGGLVTSLALASQVLRRRVGISVAAAEVRIGELRLPRERLEVTVAGSAGGWPRRVRLSTPGRPAVVLAATRWLVPWPGTGHGAEVLVPRVLLAQLAGELTGAGAVRHRFGLARSGRGWWADAVPLLVVLAAIAVINVLVPATGTVGLVVAGVLDVTAFSAGVVVVASRAWPWPRLRQLVVHDGVVRHLDIYSGRVLHREHQSSVTVQRRRWVRPGLRSIPPVVCAGARIRLGAATLDVAFPEPAAGADETPMMPRPRWAAEPGLGDQLVTALRAPG